MVITDLPSFTAHFWGLNLPERVGFASGLCRFEGLEGRAIDRALLGRADLSIAHIF